MMASSKLASSDLEDDLTKCSICLEVFTDPRYLPCLHTFCRSCLQSYLSTAKKVQSEFQCPMCRTFVSKKSTVPEEIVKEIPVSRFIVSLLDKKQMIENEKMCDPCGKRDKQTNASHWCNDCCEALCGDCVVFHNSLRALSGHQLVPMNELKNKSFNVPVHHDYCDCHKEKKLEIYCFDHETPCCLTCMTVHHRKCEKVTTIDEAAKGIKENPNTLKLLDDLETITEECKKAINDRSENLKSLDKEKESFKREVISARENIDKHLDTLEKELLDNLDASHKEHALSLEDQISSYENTMKMAQNYQNVLKKCIQSVPDIQTLVEINKLRRGKLRCEETMETDVVKVKDVRLEVTLHADIKEFNTRYMSFGSVRVSATPSHTLSPNLRECLFNVQSSVSLLEHVKGQKVCITGGTCLPDGRLVLADFYLTRLLIYDVNLTQKAYIALLNKPWDVTRLDVDRVAVTIPDEQCIQIVNMKAKSPEKSIAIGKKCHGIVFISGSFILSCGSEIVKVDINGVLIKHIVLSSTDAWYVTAIRDIIVYTSDGGNSVHAITENGMELFSYRNPIMKKPAGIQSDNQGNLYVSSRGSDNILQLDTSGNLIRILFQNDALKRPQFILFSEEYRRSFIVTENHSKYKCYGGTGMAIVDIEEK